MIAGDRVRLRRAGLGDVDFLTELVLHEQVEPYLAARGPKDRAAVLARVERSEREPEEFGVFVIEVGGRPVGTMQFEVVNRLHHIAQLGGLAIHPDFRGRSLADDAARLFQRHLLDDLGMHRLQLEIYGFNERAMLHAQRVGFVPEGTRRTAYLRHGEWTDGVLYGLVPEDLEQPSPCGLDPATPLGAQVLRCLREETLVWLTTLRPAGRPLPTLVWFVWDGEVVWIYSRPRTAELSNIVRNRFVALHFQTDPHGERVSIADGVATLPRDVRPAHELPAYLEKYASRIEQMGMTAQEYGRTYCVPIRVEIIRVHSVRP